MFSLIIYLILAIVFGYFSTQNTGPVILNFGPYRTGEIPLYVGLGITLLVGLFFSWLVSLIDSLSATLKLMGKEHVIKDDKKMIKELSRKINQLEIENAKLSGQLEGKAKDPDSL